MAQPLLTRSSSSSFIPSDYAIQVTDGNSSQQQQQQAKYGQHKQQQLWQNPDYEYRQVPPYRPINRFLDKKSRPWGSNRVETVFVFTMFQGVWIKSTMAWIWRFVSRTLNVSERWFEARVGGEL